MNRGEPTAIALLIGLCLGLLFSILIFSPEITHGNEIQSAISKCEIELPRHLNCEPVYGARVVEEK